MALCVALGTGPHDRDADTYSLVMREQIPIMVLSFHLTNTYALRTNPISEYRAYGDCSSMSNPWPRSEINRPLNPP